jgi:hypothetical protein
MSTHRHPVPAKRMNQVRGRGNLIVETTGPTLHTKQGNLLQPVTEAEINLVIGCLGDKLAELLEVI